MSHSSGCIIYAMNAGKEVDQGNELSEISSTDNQWNQLGDAVLICYVSYKRAAEYSRDVRTLDLFPSITFLRMCNLHTHVE